MYHGLNFPPRFFLFWPQCISESDLKRDKFFGQYASSSYLTIYRVSHGNWHKVYYECTAPGALSYLSHYVCSFWSCVCKNSKAFPIFFKFGRNFDAQILKIGKIHRKSKIKQTSVLFCEYILNKSSDLYEIW